MESLDVRLLRAQFLDEAYTIRGIHPRNSAVGLARRVGASRITIRRRLARWRTEGFWNGIVTFPNPEALGARFQLQPLLLESDRDQYRLETAIRETLEPLLTFQIGGFYGALTLTESPQNAARRQRTLEKASGCRVITPPFDIPFPKSEVDLTARDWKILRSFRRSRELDWARTAEEAGMTLRSLERRVDRLMGANALFFQPLLDFRRLPASVAWVSLLYGTEIDPRRFWSQLTQSHPDVLGIDPAVPVEIFLPASGRPPSGGAVSFFLPVASGSSADQVRRELSSLPGVVEVQVGFPTQCTTVAKGVDDRIARVMKRAGND